MHVSANEATICQAVKRVTARQRFLTDKSMDKFIDALFGGKITFQLAKLANLCQDVSALQFIQVKKHHPYVFKAPARRVITHQLDNLMVAIVLLDRAE